ncbi:MAG TPA: response regulator [Bryobacteraceae bacterium]|nr:response regulator [Bryobacteraceae bacterium]
MSTTSKVTQEHTSPTVLVLDDEPEIRKIVSTVLTSKGYTVLTADGGENAIKAFQKHKQPLDLLLLDVVSPGMSGPMVADRITELQPGLRVMFMSGYDHTKVVRHYVVDKGFALLTKPFTADQLVKKVREVLESPAPEPVHAD